MGNTLTLIHTNDIHSHFENWPRLSRLISRRQMLAQKNQSDYLTIDLGDFMDRQHPLTEASNGQENVRALNQAKYDFVTIGNNEGITNTKTQLNHLFDHAEFEVIISNLKDRVTGREPKWGKEVSFYTTDFGVKIALIALTAPMTLTYEPFGWLVTEPLLWLEQNLAKITAESDEIILLSHLGLPMDKEIAQKFPAIKVIIGSHTHHLLEEGLMVNDTLLTACGRYGEHLGEIKLLFEDGKLVSKAAQTFSVSNEPIFPKDKESIINYQTEGEKRLKATEVAIIKNPLGAEKTLIEVTLEAMMQKSHADCAIINSGLFLGSLNAGVVTRFDLHHILPHPMNLVKIQLDGRTLKALVSEIEHRREELKEKTIIGMKFRGKVFGEIWYHSISDFKSNGIRVGQEIVSDDTQYTLVTVDHLTFLPFFSDWLNQGKVEIISSLFLREIVGDYLHRLNE